MNRSSWAKGGKRDEIREDVTHLVHSKIQSCKNLGEVDLDDRLCLAVRSRQIAEEEGRVERKGVEIFRADRVHLSDHGWRSADEQTSSGGNDER